MTSQELPLMRKATAVWLVENTSLTFEQIADFCGLHELEVQGIADGDVASGIIGQNPIVSGQLTEAELKKCETDSTARLKLNHNVAAVISKTAKKVGKYTPIARRQDKPDGIAFLLKYYPDITNLQIRKLIGTTNKMIDSIRNRSHWNIKNIKPRDVVLLGLCSQSQFNKIVLENKGQFDEGESTTTATININKTTNNMKIIKKVVKKAAAKIKKAPAKKPAVKKTTVKKVAAKKPVAKKTTTKKVAVKKTATKKPVAKKTTVKKAPAKKPAAKKAPAKK